MVKVAEGDDSVSVEHVGEVDDATFGLGHFGDRPSRRERTGRPVDRGSQARSPAASLAGSGPHGDRVGA
jgi:hypothetical protein